MSDLSETVKLAIDLVSRPSITPQDEGCQELMCERLRKLGFTITEIHAGNTKNFYAEHGTAGPNIGFAGHTDVVPTGPADLWTSTPFEPSIKDNMLFGRGTADMKGSLAAMIIACEKFITENPNHPGKISFLITSDEEGPATDGTIRIVEHLQKENIQLDYCIVGEPSSTDQLGDIIKNGRRGSINATMKIIGTAGHVAYPHLADNPLHKLGDVVNALTAEKWDNGNEYFPATTFQISNINGGTGATNVIPAFVELVFNFRFSSEITDTEIRTRVKSILDELAIEYELEWKLSGQPFLTPKGELVAAVSKAISDTVKIDTTLSTTGGTSDGRFIAQLGTQVVELGPLNATIHQVDECVDITDLDNLAIIYQRCLENMLLAAK